MYQLAASGSKRHLSSAALPSSSTAPGPAVDHPLVSWLLENGAITLLAWLRTKMNDPDRKKLGAVIANNVLGGFIIIEGAVLLQYLLVNHVYKHKKWFNDRERPKKFLLTDWVQANLLTHILGAASLASVVYFMPEEAYKRLEKNRDAPTTLFRFLKRMFIARVVADVAFYVIHRAMHHPSLYWIHRRHHEHKATGLPTNFHFSLIDLFLEGFVPLFSALNFMDKTNMMPNNFEVNLIATYLQWYEIGSHSGKELPTVSYMPPLAPIYNAVLNDIDKNNVQFHETHHNRVRCNYGITQWIDHVLDTAKEPYTIISRRATV